MTIPAIDLDAALNDVLEHEYDTAPATDTPATPEPYIAALPVDSLIVDGTYQRDLDEHRVNKMADVFDLALVGIVEVSARPDGKYAVLDGQHRVATIRNVAIGSPNENPHIACRVHTGLNRLSEAKLYHQLNTTRRQLTGWDRWVARRGAADPAVLDIEATAHRHNLVIGMQAGNNVLRATGSCEKVVELGGLALLSEVFEVIRAAWPDDQAGLDGAIIHGLGHVLHSYTRDELDLARLTAGLAGILPRQMTARADAVRELHKGTRDRLTAHVIVERYNSIKGTRLQGFFDRVKPLSKTQTMKARNELAERERIRTWALESGYVQTMPRRVTTQMREAYADAIPSEVSS